MDSLIVKATIQAVTLNAISNTIAQLLSCYQEGRPYRIDPAPLARFITFALFSCPPNILWQSWLESTFPGYTSPSESGTTESIAQQPAVQAMSEKAAPVLQSLNEKTSAATSAVANNEAVQSLKRRATDGMDFVKAKASEINARSATIAQKTTGQADPPSQAQTFSTPDGQVVEKVASGDPVQDALPNKAGGDKKLNVKNTAIKFGLDQTLGALVNTIMFIAGMGTLKGDPFSAIMSAVWHDTLPLIFAGQKLWPAVSIISFTLVPLEHRTIFGGIIGVGWGIFLSLFASGKK